jgi:predicted nucleic acid-binding protein
VIYLDTCLVIYAIEPNGSATDAVLTALERTDDRIAVSPLVLMECLAGAIAAERADLIDAYEAFYQSVETIPLTADVLRAAARVRSEHRVKTPDAIHLAAARIGGCREFWTNDARLARAAPGFAASVLDG